MAALHKNKSEVHQGGIRGVKVKIWWFDSDICGYFRGSSSAHLQGQRHCGCESTFYKLDLTAHHKAVKWKLAYTLTVLPCCITGVFSRAHSKTNRTLNDSHYFLLLISSVTHEFLFNIFRLLISHRCQSEHVILGTNWLSCADSGCLPTTFLFVHAMSPFAREMQRLFLHFQASFPSLAVCMRFFPQNATDNSPWVWNILFEIWVPQQKMSSGMFSSSHLTRGPRCWTSSLIAPHGLPVCSTPGLPHSAPTVATVRKACLHILSWRTDLFLTTFRIPWTLRTT